MNKQTDRAPRPARALRRLVPLALLSAAIFLFLSAGALAARPYESQITGTGPEPSDAFVTPSGLAVDGSDNVWVSDTGTGIVSKFEESSPLTFSLANSNDGSESWNTGVSPYTTGQFIQDLAFGESAGLVYVADSNFDDLWGLNESDAIYSGVDPNTGIGGCCYIEAAVDNSGTATDGDIYVTSYSGSPASAVTRIDGSGAAANFSASASYISANQLTGTPDQAFGTPKGVAVDASGDVYVVDQGNSEVYEFDSSGTFLRAIPVSGILTDIAVDPTNGNILVGDSGNGRVHELTSTGTPVGNFDGSATPAGSFAPQGIAVDSTGRLYVVDSAHSVVDVFGPPSATHALTVTKAGTGSGTVTSSPAGINCGATCEASFAEGNPVTLTAAPFAHSTFSGWSGPDAGSCNTEPTCEVTIGAADAALTATFAQKAPLVSSEAAGAIGQHGATLSGKVNPEGASTSCEFEYGTTTAYGSSVPCTGNPIGSSSIAVAVTAPTLTGLTPATTYHYRLDATNSGGTTEGTDHTFTTLADTCETNTVLCPPPPLPDTDGDGIPDPSDHCATQAGPASNSGCPLQETSPPRNEAAYRVCITKVAKAYRNALKRAHTPAGKKAAKKKKKKAIKKCAARYL